MKRVKKKLGLYSQKQGIDMILLVAIISLSLFGLLMIYDASSVSALEDFGDKMYFVKEQSKWLIIGLLGLFISSRVDYRRFYHLAVPLLLLTIILLVAVFIPGLGVFAYGARRWLNFGFFVLQPAELAKISLIIYLAAWLSTRERGRLLAFLTLMILVSGLILLEPDLGTSLIIGIVAILMYFVSEAPFWHFILLIPILVSGAIFASLTSSYRLARITSFLDPTKDPQGASYHIRQILLALGSGGIFGLGFGKSRQKYAYLPEATTDSIFAIIGEEVGFIGTSILIIILLFILLRSFRIARNASCKFGYLLGMGITFWLAVQILINLSSVTTILPLTGVPLPFISYGGSGLVVSLFGIGILLNLSKNRLIKK